MNAGATTGVKLVMQQCLSAQLKLPPDYSEESVLTIRRGMVAFVCFMKGATEETAIKAAETICNAELSPTEEEDKNKKRVSVLKSEGDILIIPQVNINSYGPSTEIRLCRFACRRLSK